MKKELINLTINGAPYELEVEPNLILNTLLRDRLGLTGTKISCGEGECGACTVLVDGKPMLSCSMLAVAANGKNITTIEGLAPRGTDANEARVDRLRLAEILLGPEKALQMLMPQPTPQPTPELSMKLDRAAMQASEKRMRR